MKLGRKRQSSQSLRAQKAGDRPAVQKSSNRAAQIEIFIRWATE
jgi:hypothetical protein